MSRRTKRIVIWSLVGIALIALAIPKLTGSGTSTKGGAAAAAATPKGGAASGKGGARGAGGPTAVQAMVVAPAGLSDRLQLSGTVLPNEQVELRSEVPGKIVAIYFNEGQVVGQGKLLLKTNDAELRAQYKRALYRKTLAAAKEARQRQLLEKNAVSPAEYDIAISELNTANAEIELIAAQIAKTEIRAPFSGVIGLRAVSVGSYISPTTKIATLSSTNPVKVDFFVPERYHSAVRPGSTVIFKVAGSDQRITGRVYAVEPNIDLTTRTLQVRASAPNPGGILLPGSFAEVELSLGRNEKALTIPSEAIIPEPGGKMTVYIARNGKAESRTVGLGLRTDRNVQVLSGLASGDTVIFSGIQLVKPGGPVTVALVDSSGNAI